MKWVKNGNWYLNTETGVNFFIMDSRFFSGKELKRKEKNLVLFLNNDPVIDIITTEQKAKQLISDIYGSPFEYLDIEAYME